MNRLALAWRRYWFGTDGRLSIEIVRIAIAVGALLTWMRAASPSYEKVLAKFPAGSYLPTGILQLFGADPPPIFFLALCKVTALVAAVAMLVGLASRVSTVVCLVSMLVVAGIQDSSGTWHHQYTPILSAHLAFAFAPCGRMLSVDAALRRLWRRGRPPAAASRPAHVPAWPVLLVQFVVAFPYAAAALSKIEAGGGFSWAFSDSLRHHILARFDWWGVERTALADLIVRHAALWKAVAFANLMSQVAPLVACFFVRRPWVRFVLGSFFVIETIALDAVMGLPNYQWLPLGVVFVDWDRAFGWLRRKSGRQVSEAAPTTGAAEPAPAPRHRLASPLIAAFLAIHAAITFGPDKLDALLNSYPLSQYKMFSQINAKEPYSVHQSWEFDTLHFAIGGKARGRRRAVLALDTQFHRLHRMRSAGQVERVLRQAYRRVAKTKPPMLAAWFNILQAPAYPAEPELVRHEIAMLGRLSGETFQSLLGRAGIDESGEAYLEPRPVGLELPPDLRVTYILDRDPLPRPLEIVRRGQRLYYRPRELGRHLFIAEVGGTRFVIAQARHEVLF